MQTGAVVGGDFVIKGPLSSGGMGSVYLAHQRSTGSDRALKVMHRELVANAKLRQRFEQEARVASRIESEHVVSVVAAGVDADSGVPFLVMELLRGETLAERIDQKGPMGARLAHAMFEQLFHAIIAAHRSGIIHRDLKPDNVFLAHSMRAGGGVNVKVLDFGIAKLTAEANTQKTSSMGTPLWMAPEQADTESRVSEATDVWALGLLAFYVLTGKPYWLAAREGGSIQALLREVLLGPMPEASRRARELGTVALPQMFDAFFARATEREPAARLATAREAWATLEPMLEEVVAPPKKDPVNSTLAAAPLPCLAAAPSPCLSISLGPFEHTQNHFSQGETPEEPSNEGEAEEVPAKPGGATVVGGPLIPAFSPRPLAEAPSRAPLYLLGGGVAALGVIAGVILLMTPSSDDHVPSESSSAVLSASSDTGPTPQIPVDKRALLSALLTIEGTREPIRGLDRARVTMVWYSAFECPSCALVTPTINELFGAHPTDLRIVYRDCVLAAAGRDRSVAARLAFLAGHNNDFWTTLDYIVRNPRITGPLGPEEIFKHALRRPPPTTLLGLAKQQVAGCAAYGAEGLPLFFINGERMMGNHPLGAFQVAVERQLKLINPKLDTGMPVSQAYEEVVRANLK